MAEYHVENFGCRASRSDGEAIAAALRHRGLDPATQPADAHVVIVNTCSVTAEADRQARAFLRRVRRHNPSARIIVTGCYAQRAPEEMAALAEVDAVVGNSHKAIVADLAADYAAAHILNRPEPSDTVAVAFADSPEIEIASGSPDRGSQTGAGFVPLARLAPAVFVDDAFAHTELAALPFAPDSLQTRPNLKVQDGCGNRCSFCIIPTTRGHSRSVSLAECLEGVRRFVDHGGRELVLSGINLGRWGRDLQPARCFEELVAAILNQTALPRLRVSSIEPMDWTPGLLDLYREHSRGAHPRLARHAHLPLQSGSDAILRLMHRRYRPWHYADRLARIRELLPDAGLGADVMVGFPGETDALFEESYRFIEAQPLTYLHLFPFSARPGTPGWEMHRRNPVDPRTVRRRMEALRGLAEAKSRAFRERFVGRELSAVTLDAGDAVTDNFLKLHLAEPVDANLLVSARIESLSAEGLIGSRC